MPCHDCKGVALLLLLLLLLILLLVLQIVSLMRVAPVTEDDTLSKEPLFSKYMETLPRALDSWKETGLTMVTHLLEGVRKVVQHNPALHQELFK